MADPFFKRISERRQPLGKLFTAGAFFGFVYIISCYTEITLCPVSVFLNRQCMGCRLSRAFIEILHGNFHEAEELHVLSLFLFSCLFVYYACCIIDVLAGTKMNKAIDRFLSKKYMHLLYGVLFIGLFIWNYARNVQ